jgi:hypothetical protein
LTTHSRRDRILLALYETRARGPLQTLSLESLMRHTGLPRDALKQEAVYLESKGYLLVQTTQVDVRVYTYLQLTPSGVDYVEQKRREPTPTPPAATLVIWLRQQQEGRHEALVTFRLSDSAIDEHPLEDRSPTLALNPLFLLAHTLEIEAYGDALRNLLFAEPNFALALVRAQERALGAGIPLRLRIQLDGDDPALHAVRWELLRDPQSNQFVCLSDRLRLARYVGSAAPAQATSDAARPLSVLVALASPSDSGRYGLPMIDAAAQIAQAQQALDGYAVEVLPHATLPGLAERLRAGPAVLYLICHGALLDDGSSCLYLEDLDGTAAPTPAERLSMIIAGLATQPRLTVLAACQSAGSLQPPRTGLIAIGPQLAQAGLGAVLAMHDNVAVDTVAAGMSVLFDELRRHGNIDRAVTTMRTVLAARADDWWQPVLYLRLRDGQLWPAGLPEQ